MQRIYFDLHPALKGIVREIQILDIPDVAQEKIGNRFLPDGYFEIGFNLGSDNIKFASTAIEGIQLKNPYSYFYAQGSSSSYLFATGHLSIMIVKIYPWAATLLTGIELHELVDRTVSLENVLGKEVRFLEEKILGSRFFARQVELLQLFLIEKVYGQNKTVNNRLMHLTQLIFNAKGRFKIHELASFTHTTERTIQRLFKQEYGISPKQLSQQIRLRYFAAQLAKTPTKNFTELAIQCGYYDQAHFNRDFKSIVKITPKIYFMKNTPLVDDFLKSE